MTGGTFNIQTLPLVGNQAIGPYSDAVKAGSLVFVSGRIGLNNTTMRLIDGDVSEQTRQCLKNIGEVLEMAGCSLRKFGLIRTTLRLLRNVLQVLLSIAAPQSQQKL